jgi:DNA mismatch endonuclease (patch repair protein)
MTSIRNRAPCASSTAVRRAMQAVASENTSPETLLRRALHKSGSRYRVHARPETDLRCRADIVFRSARVCVFVDGCFWHGCPLHFLLPKTHSAWWEEKIQDNRARDERQQEKLRGKGWVVIRFWEHEVRTSLRRCVRVVQQAVALRVAAPR